MKESKRTTVGIDKQNTVLSVFGWRRVDLANKQGRNSAPEVMGKKSAWIAHSLLPSLFDVIFERKLKHLREFCLG